MNLFFRGFAGLLGNRLFVWSRIDGISGGGDVGGFGIHEVAFLLFVLFVGAGVDVFDLLGLLDTLFAFLLGDLSALILLAPRDDSVGDFGGEQANGAERVIVAGDHDVDDVGIAIGIDDGNDRHAHAARFANGDLLVIWVDDEHHVGKRSHVLDACEILLEVLQLAIKTRSFLLGELGHAAIFGHGFQKLEALDGFLEGNPVGEGAAKPAMLDIVHAAALGFFDDCFLSLALGAKEKDGASL